MNVTRFLLVSIVGAITLFILGFLIYGLIMGGTSDADATMGWRTEPVLILIFLFNWSSAMILTLIMGHWGAIRGFKDGANAGLIFGALFALTWGLAMMAFRTDGTWEQVGLELVIDAVMYTIAGGVMGIVLERMARGAHVEVD